MSNCAEEFFQRFLLFVSFPLCFDSNEQKNSYDKVELKIIHLIFIMMELNGATNNKQLMWEEYSEILFFFNWNPMRISWIGISCLLIFDQLSIDMVLPMIGRINLIASKRKKFEKNVIHATKIQKKNQSNDNEWMKSIQHTEIV